MKITIKPAKIGIDFKTQKVYPELENLEITPRAFEQKFNHPESYGYDEITVNPIDIKLQSKEVNPSTAEQIITADEEYDGLKQVNIKSVDSSIDENIKPEYIIEGIEILGVQGSKVDIENIIDETYSGEFTSNVKNVRAYCFYNYYNFTKLNFPNLEKIGDFGFYGCKNVEEFYMPNVITIGGSAFRACSKMKNVYFPKCISIGMNTFTMGNFETINLPELQSVASQGISCSTITKINIPKVHTLMRNALAGNTSLEELELPSLTRIADMYAFNNCSSLIKLVLSNNVVCSLANINNFDNTPIKEGTGYIYVPDDLVDTYKSATNWSNFANQIKGIGEL